MNTTNDPGRSTGGKIKLQLFQKFIRHPQEESKPSREDQDKGSYYYKKYERRHNFNQEHLKDQCVGFCNS